MKKKVIVSMAVLPFFILAALLPFLLQKSITEVRTTTVRSTQYSEDIFVSGLIEPQSKKEIISEIPVVPKKVFFRVGDYVSMNDTIAEIDVLATEAALFDIAATASVIPEEYMEVLGKIKIEENILKEYVPTAIKSPTNGIITSISLIEGAISTPKSVVATIVKEEQLRLRMTVNETDADKVKNGDTVVFKANATGEQKYMGTVERIFPTATKTLVGTAQATVVSMYVTMQYNYPRLKAGYTISGAIKQPTSDTINLLQYEAVLQDEKNQEYVYLMSGNSIRRCDIKTGRETAEGIEITSPDLASQRIVADATQIKNPNGLFVVMNR